METLKFVQEIKKLMSDKRAVLITERTALEKRFQKGCDFFLSTKDRTKSEIEKASKNMADITKKMSIIDKEIYDLDVIIGIKLETFFNDTEIKIQTPTTTDDTGDRHQGENPLLYFDECERVSITPEDLWALKILKPALNYRNIIMKRRDKE